MGIVVCLAASLASTYAVPIVFPTTVNCDNQKCLLTLPYVPFSENHPQLRKTDI